MENGRMAGSEIHHCHKLVVVYERFYERLGDKLAPKEKLWHLSNKSCIIVQQTRDSFFEAK
jgi:hypothetical protein